jgi:hypothetical protein
MPNKDTYLVLAVVWLILLVNGPTTELALLLLFVGGGASLVSVALTGKNVVELLFEDKKQKQPTSEAEHVKPVVQQISTPALPKTKPTDAKMEKAAATLSDVPAQAPLPVVYTIKVPRNTPWKPELAISLIREFISIRRLALRIEASERTIAWKVIDFEGMPADSDVITQVVRTVYPEAEVTKTHYKNPPFKGRFFRVVEHFHQLQDFIGPIRLPNEFKEVDPLTMIANQMNDLQAGESLSYTVYVGETGEKLYNEARKQSTRSNWGLQDIDIITRGFRSAGDSVISAAQIAYKLVLEKRPAKYRESDMNVIYSKLNDLPLVSSHIIFEVNTPIEGRTHHFDIQAAMLHYAHEFQKLMRYTAPRQMSVVETEQQDEETTALTLLRALMDKPYSPKKNPTQCIFSPSELASLWHLPHESFSAANIAWVKGKSVPMPGVMRGQTEGVCLGDNRYGGKSTPVYLLPEDRAGHMIVVGKTGMGKSTLLHNLIHQDIAAGRGVALIDPSPRDKNLVPRILQHSIPDGRVRDVVVLDLADRDTPPPLNILAAPVSVPRRDAVASIRAIFERVYGNSFSEARMGRTLGMTLHTVLADPTPTVRDIARVAWDIDYRERLLDQVTSEGAHDFWQRFASMGAGEQETYFDPILGRVEALYDNELLYPAVCHPDSLDLGTYIQQGKIILISLCPPENVGLAPSEQALLGSILVSQFQLAVMAQRPPARFFLYVDEAQHFVTTALPVLFNEARGQNLSLTLSNQFLRQLVGDTLHAVMGNVGAVIAFQVGTDDAHALGSDIMKPHFSSSDLTHMEVHHAALLMRYEGKQQEPFSLMGRDAPEAKAEARTREAAIRALSRKQYTPKSRDEVLAWLAARYPRRRRAKGKTEEEQFSDPL